MDSVLSRDALIHSLSGTMGGVISMSLFYPLDLLRSELQTQKVPQPVIQTLIKLMKETKTKQISHINESKLTIQSKEADNLTLDAFSNNDDTIIDPFRLYRGIGPLLISLSASNLVYFYANNMLKQICLKWTGKKYISTSQNLILAAIAGCINVLLTNPFWVVSARMRSSQSNIRSIIHGFQTVYKEDSIQGFWNGTQASLVLVSNPTIQFVAYDTGKHIWSKGGKRNLYSIEYFIIAALSKAIATFITYPIQIAQSKIRATSKLETDTPYKNTLDCLIKIYQKDGLKGWFHGFVVKLLQTTLMSAFHFTAYEQLLDKIRRILEFFLQFFIQ